MTCPPLRRPRHALRLAALLPLALGSGLAGAQQSPALDRVSLWLGGYDAHVDTTLGASDPGGRYGGNFSLENDLGFNDRTQSIVVRNGTWELCQHENFNGWCRTFGPGQYDDLGPLQGEITSARPR